MERLVLAGEAKNPWIIISDGCNEEEKISYLEERGGKVIRMELSGDGSIDWNQLAIQLKTLGISSVMVEGGAHVINTLLQKPQLIDSVIITIGPVYLGNAGVQVSPTSNVKLDKVTWWSGIQDTIMCATLLPPVSKTK